jgi:hypothetical protein
MRPPHGTCNPPATSTTGATGPCDAEADEDNDGRLGRKRAGVPDTLESACPPAGEAPRQGYYRDCISVNMPVIRVPPVPVRDDEAYEPVVRRDLTESRAPRGHLVRDDSFSGHVARRSSASCDGEAGSAV